LKFYFPSIHSFVPSPFSLIPSFTPCFVSPPSTHSQYYSPICLSREYTRSAKRPTASKHMDSLSILAMAAAAVQKSEMLEAGTEYRIRRPQFSDIPLLAQVERSAAELFRTANLGFLLDGPTVDPSLLFAMANANHLWVAANKYDQPIGFLGGEELDGNFHIVEISVAREYQGRGIGKALMATMLQQVRQERYKSITLTTYRNLPWNGPWYSKMGFVEVAPQDMGPRYVAILDTEAQHGMDVGNRCVMRLAL